MITRVPYLITLMYYLGSCLLITACNPSSATPQTPPVIAKAEIRYLTTEKELSADLRLYRGDSMPVAQLYVPPAGSVAFLGSNMDDKMLGNTVRWRSRMRTEFPESLRFTFPLDSLKPTEKTTLPVDFIPVVADSIPAEMSKKKRQSFYASRKPLGQGENVVVFFEPTSGGEPKRIIVAGPSATSYLNIPPVALEGVQAGNYQVYLIKQSIKRDTQPGLISAVTLQYHSAIKSVTVTE